MALNKKRFLHFLKQKVYWSCIELWIIVWSHLELFSFDDKIQLFQEDS